MASADYSVLTPERVSLEYGIAGIGSRGGAVIVDTLIQVLALSVILIAGLGAGAVLRVATGRFAEAIVIAVLAIGLFVIATGYFLIFEIIWNGQTPGKRVLGIRVIRESGYPIRPIDSVIRNVVRVVDWLPLFYGIGVLVMLFNKRARRLGDFAAGTLVVREGAPRTLSSVAPLSAEASQPTVLTRLEVLPFTEAAAPAASSPTSVTLSNPDASLVRDFLVRRASLERTARASLAQRLAAALAQRYHLPLEGDPEAFLERLAT